MKTPRTATREWRRGSLSACDLEKWLATSQVKAGAWGPAFGRETGVAAIWTVAQRSPVLSWGLYTYLDVKMFQLVLIFKNKKIKQWLR